MQELESFLSISAISRAEEGECPYALRTLLVPKKDGSTRMCVDYQDLIALTEKDSFPLPRIDKVWLELLKARYFAVLDLLMGYDHVEFDPKDRYKTAFITHRGLFFYNVMPYGLFNAPDTFQRLSESILSDRIEIDVLVYLDDVLMFATDKTALLPSICAVLQLLIRAGLKCKQTMCSLFT